MGVSKSSLCTHAVLVNPVECTALPMQVWVVTAAKVVGRWRIWSCLQTWDWTLQQQQQRQRVRHLWRQRRVSCLLAGCLEVCSFGLKPCACLNSRLLGVGCCG